MSGTERWEQEFTLRMATAVQLGEDGAGDDGLSLLLAGQYTVARKLPASDPLRARLLDQYAELIRRFQLRFLEEAPDAGA